MLVEEEEPAGMVTGEDEEGAISDNSLDVMEESSEKLKVKVDCGLKIGKGRSVGKGWIKGEVGKGWVKDGLWLIVTTENWFTR